MIPTTSLATSKPVEYHLLKFPMSEGEFSIYAPKVFSENDIELIKKLIKLWLKGYLRLATALERNHDPAS